jgi:hypothetical protein
MILIELSQQEQQGIVQKAKKKATKSTSSNSCDKGFVVRLEAIELLLLQVRLLARSQNCGVPFLSFFTNSFV